MLWRKKDRKSGKFCVKKNGVASCIHENEADEKFSKLAVAMIMKVVKIRYVEIFSDENFDRRNFTDLQYMVEVLLS